MSILSPFRERCGDWNSETSGAFAWRGIDEQGQDCGLERAETPEAGLRAGSERRPGRHPLGGPRRGVGAVRPVPAPRRAAVRRPRRGREPHLRRAPLGLPVQDRRQRIQQPGAAPQVLVVGREGRRVGRCGRGHGLGEGQSPALRPRRVPGTLRRHPRHADRAPRQDDPGAGGSRAREDRGARRGFRDGSSGTRPAALGRPAAPHRAARPPSPA